MQQFIEEYGDQIRGVISGSDRLIFRGCLRRLYFGWWDTGLNAFRARGMEEYLWQNQIWFKDYKDHVHEVSKRIKQEVVEPLKSQARPIPKSVIHS